VHAILLKSYDINFVIFMMQFNNRINAILILGVQLRFRRFPIDGFSGKW